MTEHLDPFALFTGTPSTPLWLAPADEDDEDDLDDEDDEDWDDDEDEDWDDDDEDDEEDEV